jgi:hypothetical protein
VISPDIFKNVTSPGEAAALFSFQSSEFEQVLVTEVEWLRKLLDMDDERLKPLDRTTLTVVLQTVLEMIEWRFSENQKENEPEEMNESGK